MQPIIVNYVLPAGNASTIAASQGSTSTTLVLSGPLGTTTNGVLGPYQQRVTVTSGGNDSSIYFHIIGTNQQGFVISEFLPGGSTALATSILNYRTITSIQPSASSVAQTLATTASTVSAGTNQTGESWWNFVNWDVSPAVISYNCVVQSGAATFSIQYTYDDPNNLPPGVATANAITFTSINAAGTSVDATQTSVITAWRLQITGGTGTIRAIGIQAGIAGP